MIRSNHLEIPIQKSAPVDLPLHPKMHLGFARDSSYVAHSPTKLNSDSHCDGQLPNGASFQARHHIVIKETTRFYRLTKCGNTTFVIKHNRYSSIMLAVFAP